MGIYILSTSTDSFALTLPLMSVGAKGVVSVASNIIGNQIKTMMGAVLEGNIESAANHHKELLPLFQALFWITNPILIKRALMSLY